MDIDDPFFSSVVPNIFRKRSVCDVSTDLSLPGVKREIKPAQMGSLPLWVSRLATLSFQNGAVSFHQPASDICSPSKPRGSTYVTGFWACLLHMLRSSRGCTVLFHFYLTNIWSLTGEFPFRSSFWLLECKLAAKPMSPYLWPCGIPVNAQWRLHRPPPEATVSSRRLSPSFSQRKQVITCKSVTKQRGQECGRERKKAATTASGPARASPPREDKHGNT